MHPTSPAFNATEPAVPWYRHRWPWLLMAGPAVVVVAGLTTVWIAVTRADALVTDDYYKQGKAINLDLRRDREAWRLQAHVHMAYDPADGMLRGRVQSKATVAEATKRVLYLSLTHPTLPEKDRSMILTPDAQGNFAVPMEHLEPARWRLVAEDASRQWRLHGSWNWPQEREQEMDAQAYAPSE